jgi:pimeloyl-ACP methyl ester carboxylesterase
MWAPDLRGYGSSRARDGYDVWTLSDDVRGLIEVLGLERPVLVGSDWGAELGWIFAHRYSAWISRLVAVNGPHPRTLARAVVRFEDFQTLRLPWIPIFEVPRFPEWFMTTAAGRRVLRWALLIREGREGAMDRALVDEIVARYERPEDMRGPVNWYRAIVATYVSRRGRARLAALYDPPITVPVTLVWGEEDGALSTKVAMNSFRDAKCDVEWRPLPGVGHFVGLEAPEQLAAEIRRVLGA